MRSNVRVPALALAVAACLLLTAVAEASGPYYEPSQPSRITRKLIRGMANIGLGFVEIPKAIGEEAQLLDPFTGTFTGLVKGTGRTLARAGVGVYEVLTFPVESPRGYKAIIQPEFVMLDDTRTWRDRVEDARIEDMN